jgi:hypothetical protein
MAVPNQGLEHKIEMLFQSLVECAVMMPDLRKQWHHTKKIQRRRGCFGFYGETERFLC